MTVDLRNLQTHKDSENREAFNAILRDFLPHLRKLVRHKLRQMELRGEIPRNMYSPQEVVDDVYLRIFETFENDHSQPEKLKIRMYAVAKDVLNGIREKHQVKKLSVETLLASETREMEEDYTVDADGDLVLVEDLDDISYHQDEYKDRILLLENQQIDELADSFELSEKHKLGESERKLIGKAYTDLPELTRSVTDHYVFAKLTEGQIAEVHRISVEAVREILQKVRIRFRRLF